MQDYVYDQARHIWLRPSSSSIAYSDGEVIENYLLSSLRAVHDVSTNSSELASLIRDWPTEYHLSPIRQNLLRPFEIKPSDCILELGCGCGAMTRYLGESGAKVVAVEGSVRRAQIAAERCRDLPNVTIISDNISDFLISEKFDFVTLIGVLEYAPLFVNKCNPVRSCLEMAAAFLNESGSLILAIENKLGLKYFSGCREDHVGVRYFGINDLYAKDTPVTFGKQELRQQLVSSGFKEIEFFYPFPDYKLPHIVLSEAGAKSKQLSLGDLLITGVSRDYPNSYERAFSDGLTWGVLAANDLLGEMANSFLVFADKGNHANRKRDWLAKTYSRSPRRNKFLVETTIECRESGLLNVRKQSIYPMENSYADVDAMFRHVVSDSGYIQGRLLLHSVHIGIARANSLLDVVSRFSPWVSYLFSHVISDVNEKPMLPGNFIDCVPANLIVKDDGALEYFDAEWLCESNIPLSWILVRGIVQSFSGCLSSSVLVRMTYRQFIDAMLSQYGHSLSNDDYKEADRMERLFTTYCHTSVGQSSSFLEILDRPISMIPSLATWHKAELDRVTRSMSWRITLPFRVMGRLLRGEFRGVCDDALNYVHTFIGWIGRKHGPGSN